MTSMPPDDRPPYGHFFSNSLSRIRRRAFLKTSVAVPLLAGFDPGRADVATRGIQPALGSAAAGFVFDTAQREAIDQVQMLLFPADGDGPGARDINALTYLEWAMSDRDNIEDGDPEFIIRGIGWLQDFSKDAHGVSFVELDAPRQEQVLQRVAGSEVGENWLALLVYYLIEALLLDPVYGGNAQGVGWRWVEHQPGFPRPPEDRIYRCFQARQEN